MMDLSKTISILLSLSNGAQAASFFTWPSLASRQLANSLSCNEVRIIGFLDSYCTVRLDNISSATIGDTAAAIVPLYWLDNRTDPTTINSIKYLGPDKGGKAGTCYPIQFMFYNSLAQRASAAYITPGQQESECIDFSNTTIVLYNGVKMLAGLPK